jgi:hypothetical protein
MDFKLLKLFVFFIFSFFAFACQQANEVLPECEKNKTGTIRLSNNSSSPYDFFIDNVFVERIQGGVISKAFTIKEGNNRKFYAKQVSGYILWPTEVEKTFNVVSCSSYSWQIP